MSENSKFPPPFSVLLAEYEAELQSFLSTAQALPKRKTALTQQFEQYIKDLVISVKILRRLRDEGWEPAPQTSDGEYTYVLDVYFGEMSIEDGKIQITPELVNRKLVGDLLHLYPLATRISHKVHGDYICVKLAAHTIWVRAKHLPLPAPKEGLVKVELADGNTAWLTHETLKSVNELIANR